MHHRIASFLFIILKYFNILDRVNIKKRLQAKYEAISDFTVIITKNN